MAFPCTICAATPQAGIDIYSLCAATDCPYLMQIWNCYNFQHLLTFYAFLAVSAKFKWIMESHVLPAHFTIKQIMDFS
jgi:hypothetical protein